MIAIIDYGRGNLRSVQKAFEAVGVSAIVTRDFNKIADAKALVIPGVGAFYDAMAELKKEALDEKIKDEVKKGKPIVGICLGMQVLFENGYEVKQCKGLELLKGDVLKLPQNYKIPHMGWNQLKLKGESQLLKGISEGEFVYFIHSFYAVAGESEVIKATTDYGVEVPAIVEKEHIFGLQFHPEKSGETGLKIIKNLGRLIG
ncbi:imidazole glycerol phosphate synthase subunit HisH [Alkaliphilus transvaalensis]|uniref:imidazole glycerol phosphate synthase subunit HisH n=1 Tax=Alkaliphilus transvaalensis TaxID=114628 RepID=UPI00047A7697|nr:imidazole glycerol phosphate synthase subunit HisH [Alkaliphilus transvaalensis]